MAEPAMNLKRATTFLCQFQVNERIFLFDTISHSFLKNIIYLFLFIPYDNP
jgi:hypothetical protein